MKATVKTSLMVAAVMGLMALFAGTAMAAPHGFYIPGGDQTISPEDVQALQGLLVNGGNEPDDGVLVPPQGDEDARPPDGGGNPGGNSGNDEPVEPEAYPGGNESGNNGGNVDTPRTQETPPQPGNPAPPASSSKLPNTGSQLAMFALAAIAVMAVAYTTRRIVSRRAG